MSITSILKAVAIAVTSFALTTKAFPGTITKVNQTESALCVSDYGYATFYDDNACTENPGTAVSMADDGCLANEIGRNSIYIQPGCLFVGYLVWSPGTDCDCQDECAPVPDEVGGSDFCWDLNGNAGAYSFRFITQPCAADNC